jgi:hypothetical protein
MAAAVGSFSVSLSYGRDVCSLAEIPTAAMNVRFRG